MATKVEMNISAKPAPGAPLAHEIDLLSKCYRFILQCGEEKRAAGGPHPDGSDDTKESANIGIASKQCTN